MGVPTAHGDLEGDSENEGPVETDPSNRYQRCDEILGEGAYKLVYKACDLEEGNEVAWNQLRFDHLSKREALKILSEIKILQSIRNEHIINFYASWSTPTSNGGERIVFITELMSSGTLKQYLRKTLKGVPKPKVAKSWCRQILQGLAYLHTHDPPIIHRDLKCDNIFINGNNGQLKIGDLGLAVVRHRTHVSSVLGTPEFMAPELYDEKYNEKVDIYAFGMCVLEMVTKDYPYAECTNQAQIYRKVTQGIKPQALDHIQDPEIKGFITHCLDHDASTRPSAHELLALDFLKPCIPYHIPTEAGEPNPALSLLWPARSVRTAVPGAVPLSSLASEAGPTQSQDKDVPPAGFIPTALDIDNKTYHIHSNMMPSTPNSAHQNPQPALPQGDSMPISQATSSTGISSTTPERHVHAHADSMLCSIQVVQCGERVGTRLNLKMICTCPVAGSQDGFSGSAGTHEIKFPFDTQVDTAKDVVAEMIREQILPAQNEHEAMSCIDNLVARVSQDQGKSKKKDDMLGHRSAGDGFHYCEQAATTDSSSTHSYVVCLEQASNHHPGVPLPCNPSGHDTSFTDKQRYRHDQLSTSSRSNNSSHWANSAAYITPHPEQDPSASEVLLQAHLNMKDAPSPRTGSRAAATPAMKVDPTTSSPTEDYTYFETYVPDAQPCESTQTPYPTRHTERLSFKLAAPPRPKSVHDLSYAASHSTTDYKAASYKAGSLPLFFSQRLPGASIKGAGERPRRSSTAVFENDTDVGYTSPYRHGVSSRSLNAHRRSPSCDILTRVRHTPASAASFQTLKIADSGSTEHGYSRSDQGPTSTANARVGSPLAQPVLFQSSLCSTIASLEVYAATPSAVEIQTSSSPKIICTPPGSGADASDSGISSGVLSPDSTTGTEAGPRLHASQQGYHGASAPFSTHRPHQDLSSPSIPHSPDMVTQARYPRTKSSSISSDGSYPTAMSNEAKRDIEIWSDNVRKTGTLPVAATESVLRHHHRSHSVRPDSVLSSSCTGLSDEEEEVEEDEDVQSLREQQRKELEWMRLQHLLQWKEMMKLKEQGRLGGESRIRSASVISEFSLPSAVTGTH